MTQYLCSAHICSHHALLTKEKENLFSEEKRSFLHAIFIKRSPLSTRILMSLQELAPCTRQASGYVSVAGFHRASPSTVSG